MAGFRRVSRLPCMSMQPAGTVPNPPHRIGQSGIICLEEGKLDFRHDGMTERAAAGDVLFVAKGTMHGVRNAGDCPTAYFVLAIGGDVNPDKVKEKVGWEQ